MSNPRPKKYKISPTDTRIGNQYAAKPAAKKISKQGRISVDLGNRLRARLDTYSIHHEIPLSTVVRTAIETHIQSKP